jgi:hypothetical protein
MEACPIAFFAVWLAMMGFIAFRFATRGFRGVGLGAKILHEHLAFRAASSGMVKTDVSVVSTGHRQAPIGIAFVQRTPLSIGASGANLTPDQARAIASWLREAAESGGARRPHPA